MIEKTKWELWTGLSEYTKDYHITKKRKQMFLNFLSKQEKGQKVLDLGCYHGDVVKEISQLGFQGYGADVFQENVETATKNFAEGNFSVVDFNGKFPYPDNSFDIIWAGDIIEHVYDTINLFSELNRILKKNGSLVCSTPYHGIVKMVVISLIDLKKHFHPEHPHIRFYTNKSLRMILNKYGFIVRKEHYLGRFLTMSNNMLFISQKIKELDWDKIPHTFR
jgi:SAM-dependent methyltransferase